MSFVKCSACKDLIPINCQVKSPTCSCAFHAFCLHFGLLSPKKITTTCTSDYCFNGYWLVTQKQMDDHKADFIELKNGLGESFENVCALKIQLRQSEDILDRMVELINQLDPKAYNSIKQQRLVDNLKKVANGSNKHQALQEVNVAEQKNELSPLDECANNKERLNNEQKPVEKTSLYCKCNLTRSGLHFRLFSTEKITPTCSARYCFSQYWLIPQWEMDNHKADLIQLEKELCESLENLGPLKIQLRECEHIKERMAELINQLDPEAYNLTKQQMLVDILKKVTDSSNKHQTLQEVYVAEQKNELSPLDECAKNLESSNNEQKSFEETKILNNTTISTYIRSLEEHQTPHASDIENLHVEKIQMNQQSSENLENLKELNDKKNSTEEHKRFEEFAENIDKKIALLLEQNIRLDRIEKNMESLNKLMTPAEVNSKNSRKQQEQRGNQFQNIDSIIE